MGPAMAKISVSALVVDYILTGPISSVSAGQYLGRLLNEILSAVTPGFRIKPKPLRRRIRLVVTLYFWWANIKGIHRIERKASRIMPDHDHLVIVLLIWCPITLICQREGGTSARPHTS